MHRPVVASSGFVLFATGVDLFHVTTISQVVAVGIGAVSLLALGLALFMYLASLRLAARAKELERRVVARTTELTAVNEKLLKKINERQAAKDAIPDPEEKFHQLADHIQEIFWMMDAATKHVIYVNPAFEQIAGRTVASLLDAPLSYRENIHPDDRVRFLINLDEAAKTGVFDEEFRIIRPDGSIRWLRSRGFPIRDQQKNLYRLAGIAQDITDRKAAEQALRESQAELARASRIVTMGELAASISHEIRQPLTAIVATGSATLRWLTQQPPNVDEAREAVTGMVRDANHASAVIEKIRELLKGSSPQLRRLNVNEVVREVLAVAANDLVREGIVVRTVLAPDVPSVLGDRVLLQQVMLNLITNGIDAMSMVTGRLRELLIHSTGHPDGALIQVQDSGKGIDSEQMQRIFEPFFTTKAEGIGLGLSISRSIIEALGGRLWAAPASPHGAIFQFTLPVGEAS